MIVLKNQARLTMRERLYCFNHKPRPVIDADVTYSRIVCNLCPTFTKQTVLDTAVKQSQKK